MSFNKTDRFFFFLYKAQHIKSKTSFMIDIAIGQYAISLVICMVIIFVA